MKPAQYVEQLSSVIVLAAYVFSLRARIWVASVRQPYHFQLPTLVGWKGPVGVADVEELLDVVLENEVVVLEMVAEFKVLELEVTEVEVLEAEVLELEVVELEMEVEGCQVDEVVDV